MGVVLDIVRQTVVDDVGQIVHIQASCCYVGSHQKLDSVLAELLHREVALLLREVAVQTLSVIPVAYQFVSHLLRLQFRTTEDDGEDARIKVNQTLQSQVFVFGIHHIIYMVHVFGSFVARTHHDFLVVVKVTLGNALYVAAHRSREE